VRPELRVVEVGNVVIEFNPAAAGAKQVLNVPERASVYPT